MFVALGAENHNQPVPILPGARVWSAGFKGLLIGVLLTAFGDS